MTGGRLGLLASVLAASACVSVEARGPQLGSPAPEYVTATLEGDSVSLASLRGEVVLVNLWATWCYPCREEMPSLDALELEMGGESFEVVAINVDTGDDTKPKKFLDETGINALGYYRDATMEVFNELKRRGLALGLPVTLLVGADGCLLAHMNGPADWSGEDAKRVVRAALGS